MKLQYVLWYPQYPCTLRKRGSRYSVSKVTGLGNLGLNEMRTCLLQEGFYCSHEGKYQAMREERRGKQKRKRRERNKREGGKWTKRKGRTKRTCGRSY